MASHGLHAAELACRKLKHSRDKLVQNYFTGVVIKVDYEYKRITYKN